MQDGFNRLKSNPNPSTQYLFSSKLSSIVQ